MSSSGSETDLTSSPVKRLSEADKQILKWAGTLELESIELRDKSSKLLQILAKNGKELNEAGKKLNSVYDVLKDLESIRQMTPLKLH